MGCILDRLGINAVQPLDEDILSGRRDGEKFVVKIVAFSRIILLVFGYLGIILLVTCYSNGYWPSVLKVMLLTSILPELVLIAFLFVGALKIFSTYYVGLFFVVNWYAEGPWTYILQVLTLTGVPLTVFCGIILFYGALYEKMWALEAAIWLCLAIASYNTIIGVMGLLYFTRHGEKAIHFIIAMFFGLLVTSLFPVIFHDIIIIHTLKKTISYSPHIPDMMYEVC